MEKELTKSIDDLHRRIGRNLLLFQEIEHILKFIISKGNISGYISELKTVVEQQQSKVKTETMGGLVSKFIERTYTELSESVDELKKNEVHLSFSFKIESTVDDVQERKETLDSLVSERNELVHHLLPKLNKNSLDGIQKLSADLDKQGDKITFEINHFREIVKHIQTSRQTAINYMISDDYKKHMKASLLRDSYIVLILIDISNQFAGKERWVSLSDTGRALREYALDDMNNLKFKYGYKTIKPFMDATGLFDFKEGPPNNFYYRLKDNWQEIKSNNITIQ